jgi:hypothetical protein
MIHRTHGKNAISTRRENQKFLMPINVIWVVQSPSKKYSASLVGQISGLTLPVSPE